MCALSIAPRTGRELGSGVLLALAGLILMAGTACRRGDATASGNAEAEAKVRVDALIEVFTPLDRTVPSNVTDVRFKEGQELLAELSAAGPEVGHAALAALREGVERPVDVERALLMVGARAATAEAQPLLENLLTQYGASLHLRTEGTFLLAEVLPHRAIELLEPIVTRQKQESTMPPHEFLLKAWVVACDKTGRSPVKELADVATNLFAEGSARVLAVKELGLRRDPRGEAALRAILVESTGDGYLRRKVVQSLYATLPSETACALFRQVAEREADLNFLRFMADVLGDWCD